MCILYIRAQILFLSGHTRLFQSEDNRNIHRVEPHTQFQTISGPFLPKPEESFNLANNSQKTKESNFLSTTEIGLEKASGFLMLQWCLNPQCERTYQGGALSGMKIS